MEAKADLTVDLLKGKDVPALLEVYYEFNHLKQLYRQGWLKRGIPKEQCESVAEHTLGVAILALFISDSAFPELDRGRVLRMALLHDFGEIYAGDIIPGDEIPAEQKHRLEFEAVAQVFTKLPQGDEYLAVWQEYETGLTPEARFVKQIDRLEMALQASIYQRQGYSEMQDFFASAGRALSDPRILSIMEAVLRLGIPTD